MPLRDPDILDKIELARHIAYLPTDIFSEPAVGSGTCESALVGTGDPVQLLGTPIVTRLSPYQCLTSKPEFPGARHVGYTLGGIPIVAIGWTCCDAFSDTYVQAACWPLGEGPGITDVAYAYLFNLQNCMSASGQRVLLTYSAITGKWSGTASLRGGSLSLLFSCDPLEATGSVDKFLLEWSGCDTGSTRAGYNCVDPLLVNFANISLPNCCDCPPAHTTQDASVNIFVVANCRRLVMGRHVSYTPGGIPIIARERSCQWHGHRLRTCSDMTCGLVATITADGVGTGGGNCLCLEATIDIDQIATSLEEPHWQNLAFGSCTSSANMNLRCTNNCHEGTVTLQLDVVCGATNTGTATLVIPAEDMEDLDITFDVDMIDPSAGGSFCGTCTFQWNAMAMSWSTILDLCTGGCTCVDSVTLPPGTIDGEIMVVACEGAAASTCCIGTIHVRIMR